MHKLMVLYPEPADREAFAEYYVGTHLPLAAKLPGLLSFSYSLEITPGPDGQAPYYAVFEALFRDRSSFSAAMSSPEGRAVGADVPNYATGGAVVMDFAVMEGQ